MLVWPAATSNAGAGAKPAAAVGCALAGARLQHGQPPPKKLERAAEVPG